MIYKMVFGMSSINLTKSLECGYVCFIVMVFFSRQRVDNDVIYFQYKPSWLRRLWYGNSEVSFEDRFKSSKPYLKHNKV